MCLFGRHFEGKQSPVEHELDSQNEPVCLKILRMPKSFYIVFLSVAVFFLSSCNKNGLTIKIGDQDILALGAVDSCNFIQNSQGIRVSWKSARPVHFVLTSSVPPEFDATIARAADIWNNTLNADLIKVHRDNNVESVAADDRQNRIVWSTDWPDELSQEQARTGVRWDMSKLRDSDIKINAKHYTFYREEDSAKKGKVSLQSIMVHEMGHGIGLRHISDGESVMQAYLASGISRILPAKVDRESLGCEY